MQNFRALRAFSPDPQPPAAGGFAPTPPLASGGWGPRPQTPKIAPLLRISGYAPGATLNLLFSSRFKVKFFL